MLEIPRHATIKITEDKIIYFDPYNIEEELHDADYIFITHDHYDHYDEESIKKIIKDSTILIGPTILKDKINKLTNNILVVEPNKSYQIGTITFDTTSAYNLSSGYHPKSKNYVGYNLNLNNTKYYVMGDTDDIPEIANIKTDICFVPIGGTYTMNAEEAAAYINKIKPKKVVPIHYGSIVGAISLKDTFKQLVNKDIEVEIHIK